MRKIHTRVPFGLIGKYSDFLKAHRFDLEVYLAAEDLDAASPEQIRSAIDALGYLPALTVHAPFYDLSPGAVDLEIARITRRRFMQALDAAGAIGASRVVIHSGYEKWHFGLDMGLWLRKSMPLWLECIRRAEGIGCTIAVENIFEDEPGNLVALMKETGSERFGICFDAGHQNLFTKVPLSKWLDTLGPHIVELHVHDNVGDRDAHLPIGAGNIDFGTVFRAVVGRDVVYTIEATTPDATLASLRTIEGMLARP